MCRSPDSPPDRRPRPRSLVTAVLTVFVAITQTGLGSAAAAETAAAETPTTRAATTRAPTIRAVTARAAAPRVTATRVAATRVAATVADEAWTWPLDPRPRVVRGFVPPRDPWGPGHRGVDLAGHPGQPVLAVADGTVSFVGTIAGVGVVAVHHGSIRSTYQPVRAVVRVGDVVAAGDLLGTLTTAGSHCLPASCLHLGARARSTYLDPLSLLGGGPIRLKPWQGLLDDDPPAMADPRAATRPGGLMISGARVSLTVGGA